MITINKTDDQKQGFLREFKKNVSRKFHIFCIPIRYFREILH